MDLRPELHLKQTQKLIMTPQLQQAIKMLQLSTIELSQRIEEELVENPALEVDELEEGYTNEPSTEELFRLMEKTKDEKVSDDFNEESLYLEKSFSSSSSDGEDKKREFIEGAISREQTLREYLLQQIQLYELQPDELEIARIVISYIDEMGYLSVSLEEISREFSIPIEKLERVLRVVQSLEPPGVGARDIKECLMIQLREKGDYPLAERIITNHLNELRLRKYNEIAKKLKVSRAKLKEMIGIISSLEPYPGRQFYSEGIRYIIPDVIVERRDGKLEVVLNTAMIPRLRVNRYFEELLRKRDLDGRIRDFVSERVRRARAFIQSIEQRENTLIRVTRAIVEHQPEFFEKGPLHLRPMTLKDIARAVEIHESTVSRITSSKYVQTPFGVFRLKYFFSTAIQGEDRKEVSTRSIKELIREIIKSENPGSRRRLSDQKIAEILSRRGIKIARRTVAKYRKELQILPSNLRRP